MKYEEKAKTDATYKVDWDFLGGRFKADPVIAYIHAIHQIDLNVLYKLMTAGVLDRESLKRYYRMIGYSLSGYEEIFEEEYEEPEPIGDWSPAPR